MAKAKLRASTNSGRTDTIVSIDLDPDAAEAGLATLYDRPGAERVSFFTVSGDDALRAFTTANRRFQFCFIDHSHRYEHVRSAATLMPKVLQPVHSACGMITMIRPSIDCEDYGVYQGVRDGLDMTKFEFWGIFGCTGLFRYKP